MLTKTDTILSCFTFMLKVYEIHFSSLKLCYYSVAAEEKIEGQKCTVCEKIGKM